MTKPLDVKRCLPIVLTALLAVNMPIAIYADSATEDRPANVIRFATFNASLSGKTVDELPKRLTTSDDEQLKKIAAIIQTVRPDVLLINEFDHDPTGQLAADFQTNYLGVPQDNTEPITFAHAYSPAVNTGLPTEIDLDGDGQVGGPGDAHGWGDFPGQYGMLLLTQSDDPPRKIVDQQRKLWSRFPGSNYPQDHYPAEAEKILRLSSKTHQMLRMTVRGTDCSVFISHPTPPVFDGPEDRNGKRNHDEVRMIAMTCIRSVDQFHRPIVILGDLNADPNDGESIPGTVDQLLNDRRFSDPQPRSRGAVAKAIADGGANATHKTDPALDTADWNDAPPRGSGNLRVDYVIPTHDWTVVDAGVFWPRPDEPSYELINASDHRLVWVDLNVSAD
ncbi:MAG: endonuclease/exonuclease/phosphatase family protein [Planctomycetota bacterium]